MAVTIPKYQAQFSQYVGSFDSPFKSNLAFGKLSWQMAPNMLVDASGNYRREKEVRDFGGTTSFESATAYRNWVNGATLRHQWNNSSALNEATLSLQKFGFNPEPANPGLVGKLYFAPGFNTTIRTGGNSTFQDLNQARPPLPDTIPLDPTPLRPGPRYYAVPRHDMSAMSKASSPTGRMLVFTYAPEAPFMPSFVFDAARALAHYTEIPLPGPRLPHGISFA